MILPSSSTMSTWEEKVRICSLVLDPFPGWNFASRERLFLLLTYPRLFSRMRRMSTIAGLPPPPPLLSYHPRLALLPCHPLQPKLTSMRQVTTIVHKLAPTNWSTDILSRKGIRPFELRDPPRILQPIVPNNNGIDEIINGPKGQMAPATKPPYYSTRWG